jgi:hypothetical protein
VNHDTDPTAGRDLMTEVQALTEAQRNFAIYWLSLTSDPAERATVAKAIDHALRNCDF